MKQSAEHFTGIRLVTNEGKEILNYDWNPDSAAIDNIQWIPKGQSIIGLMVNEIPRIG